MAEEFGAFSKQEVKPIDVDAIPKEDKAEFLKRIAQEKKDAKKNAKALESWFVVSGNKLIKKTLKASGSVYSQYLFNIAKNKDLYAKYKDQLKSSDYKPEVKEQAKVEEKPVARKRGK